MGLRRLAGEVVMRQGQYTGKPVTLTEEEDHFMKCQVCGGWIDLRDLTCVFEHEGSLPHPSQDQEN